MVGNLPSVKTDFKYKDKLLELSGQEDIPIEWRNTPIEALIMAQNFGWPISATTEPKVLIVSCIEARYQPPIPRMYAYVIRRASGRLVGSEFSAGYVLSKGVEHLVLVGHNDCGMVKVHEAAPQVVDALVRQGWSRQAAQKFVEHYVQRHSISDELGALEAEYRRLSHIFHRLTIAPLFVSLFDNKLYIPKFYFEKSNIEYSGITNEEISKLMN